MTQTDYDYCEEVRSEKTHDAQAVNAENLTEVQLIQVILDNLPHLKKAGAKRVLDYAQRFYEDTFGKEDKKVYR